MTDKTYLCVMSDDLGMHPAINEGIAKAFTDGLLTDANIMSPCPAFREGAALARQLGLPTGLHATLNCEWDLYRWGPLTKAPSLTAPDGCFYSAASQTWKSADDAEVLAELTAQVEAMEAEGIHSTHASYHVGTDGHGRMFRALAQIGADRVGALRVERGREHGGMPVRCWSSAFFTSMWTLDYKRRKAALKARLRRMEPGYHLWMVHAALDHPSLDALCSPEHPARSWARAFRAADFALLMDHEVMDVIEERGIERINVTCAPVEGLVN